MKVLQKIDSQYIVAIDIETVRIADKFEDLSEGYQSAWEYKNKQDGKIPTQEELSDLWVRTSSLYAEFSKICAASLVFLYGDKLYCKEFFGEDEAAILESVSVTLHNMSVNDSRYRLAGHASKYFDYPFLAKRYIINGLDIPNVLDVTSLKPWEQTNLCTNELWKVGGTGAGSSLQALCNVLDVPTSKVDLVGDEVGEAYYKGEFERIGRYCSYDAVATFNVIRKFKKETIFRFDEVEYILATATESKTEVPVLEQVFNNKELTPAIEEQLNKLLAKKRKSKADKVIIQDIITSLVLKTDFDNKDSKDDVERKKKQVQEFIGGL